MMLKAVATTEGYAEFKYPSLPAGKPCQTWYRIVGDLNQSKKTPLVVLHGGPGATHCYLKTPFEHYAIKYDTPVIFYDQIGCGKTTHYREKRLDEGFWTNDLFVSELDNLVEHLGIAESFDLYGQSWGAMLSAKYAASSAKNVPGLRRLVLGNGPCNMADWTIGADIMIAEQPQEIQEIIRKIQKSHEWEDEEYKAAVQRIYNLHMCRLKEWPNILLDAFAEMAADDTTYMTMMGPDELVVLGSLRDFNMAEECKAIKKPTLLINGEFDECMDFIVKPWFRGIDKVKWISLSDASHMLHLEFPDKFCDIVSEFLS